jgi:ribonuclease P protein component
VRLGLTVSRRVGHAVVRNRLKRRIREWFLRHRSMLPTGVDLVVIARAPAARLSWTELEADLCALVASEGRA